MVQAAYQQPDYFERGVKLGSSYQEGQDAAAKRGREATEASDISNIRQEQGRGLKLSNDETVYKGDRAKKLDAAVETAWGAGGSPASSGSAAPATPTLDDYGKPLEGAAPQAGTGLARQGAPSSDLLNKARKWRLLSQAYGTHGDVKNANDYEAKADTAEQDAAFEEGASLPTSGPAWEAARKNITGKSKFVQITVDKSSGREFLSVQQPNGHAELMPLTDTQKRTILGASSMMAKGYVTAALGKLSKVDADLATAAKTDYEVSKGVVTENNNARFQTEEGKAKLITANAHAASVANAAAKDKSKQAFGPVVNLVDKDGNAMVMQPYMVNGVVKYEKPEIPEGSHFATQKPEVTVKMNPDGTGISTDRSGNVVNKFVDNMMVPAEKDIFEGKKGEDVKASWENKGVVRQVGEFPPGSGKLKYGFTSTDDPEQRAWPTPQAAEMAGKKAKAAGRSSSGGATPTGTGVKPNQAALDEQAQMRQAETAGIRRPAPTSEGTLDSGT